LSAGNKYLLLFHVVCGHSTELTNKTGTEVDGLDEGITYIPRVPLIPINLNHVKAIITGDGSYLIDNVRFIMFQLHVVLN
jgi:hypothetical protein